MGDDAVGEVEGPAAGRARRAIVRNALGVGLATGTYGLSFGAVATAAGLSALQTCALSLLIFTGAGQFALVGARAQAGVRGRPCRPRRCSGCVTRSTAFASPRCFDQLVASDWSARNS